VAGDHGGVAWTMKKNTGFTLLELLVVISIIALLLAILVPSLRKAKELAMMITCRQNLRSLGLATYLYAEAHEGKLYPYGLAFGLYITLSEPYISNMNEARYCPATRIDKRPNDAQLLLRFGTSKNSWMWNWGTKEPEYGSYGLNGWFYNNQNLQPEGFTSWYSVPRPAETPIFADCMWVDAWPDSDDYVPLSVDLSGVGQNYNIPQMNRFMIDRHRNVANVAFVDGHAGSVELREFWSLKWHLLFKTQHDKKRSDGQTPIYSK
jgi:prepilin-type N-terminal cleavage/methylation domain-containing protein/prepilin-type processing-associated H-X9-DG protein